MDGMGAPPDLRLGACVLRDLLLGRRAIGPSVHRLRLPRWSYVRGGIFRLLSVDYLDHIHGVQLRLHSLFRVGNETQW